MKTIVKLCLPVLAILLTGYFSTAQKSASISSTAKNNIEMKTYVIEREVPNASTLTAEQLKGISQTSCSVLKEMGPRIEWLHSYVAGNKIFCIYKADSEETIREHAKKGGFPANVITQVAAVISPATAD